MTIKLGRKIKSLRLERNMTQEMLADALNISPQAISKWENGINAPDISTLPAISVVFGVTIDDLFSLTDEETLERIENMLYSERDLSESTFASTESRLKDMISQNPDCGEAHLRIAELYQHRIESMTRTAVKYAKHAIKLMPEKKDCHSIISSLIHGYGGDWTCNNTLEMVRYYREITKTSPNWQEGWGWLLDHLIGNGLLSEARAVITDTAYKNNMLAKARLGEIAYAEGNGREALQLWQECIDDSPSEWKPYAFRADMMVYMGCYRDAIKDYSSWLEKQPKPRFVDPCICMALLYEELGEIDKAIFIREEQFNILKDEHHFEEGEIFDSIAREIERLKSIKQ